MKGPATRIVTEEPPGEVREFESFVAGITRRMGASR